MPDEVYHATRSHDSSLLLVVALALSSDEPTRRQQLALVEQQLGTTRAELCRRLFGELERASADLRLPVLELALPTLRQRPREQLAYLSELLTRVQELETAPRLFDFVLLRVLKAYLRDVPGVECRARERARARDRPRRALGRARPARATSQPSATSSRALRARRTRRASPPSVGVCGAGEPTFEPPAAARDLARLDSALAAVLTRLGRATRSASCAACSPRFAPTPVTATAERELFRVIASVARLPAAARRRRL